MDTQRRDVAGGASVDSASKKLRQALLPFQVVSPVGVSSSSKKRKIIDNADAKGSKNLRIEKQAPEIIDFSEAKENVNLEKSETLTKEKCAEVINVDSSDEGNGCNKSEEEAIKESAEWNGNAAKEDEKSIEIESDSELDKTEENADNMLIGDCKERVSGNEETTSTPKQRKKLLSLKKKEQREKVKEELERKREERKKEKEERILQKKKEKEEEMQRRLSQKLEEKQKKEEEREQKKKQKEEEKLKKEEEKQRREEERQKEKQKKEEEKKKLEEEEEQKKKKAAAAFASFFVPKKCAKEEDCVTVDAFMPFRVKGDMRLAPVVRRILSKEEKKEIELKMADQSEKKLYLMELREKSRNPMTHPETWPLRDFKEDVIILEEEDVPTSEDRLVLDPHHDDRFRGKLLQFCENRRPPYWGTWRKRSSKVGPRRPFYRDEKYFDYEIDSDDEWEEEEPGESLHGSDDEKESEDEYEVDNEFFVPHGYLSDEEAAAEEADDEVVSPETQKAKLKLLGMEFEEEMKQKTKQIKAQLIGCYWIYETMDEHLSHQYEKIFSQYKAVSCSEVIPTSFIEVASTPLATAIQVDATSTSSAGRKKKIFPEEVMPDLIKLLHGNRNGGNFLALEFYAYISKGKEEEERGAGESPLASNSRVSKGSISKKIREIATWKLCTDQGPSYGKNYWYVSDSVRAQYNLRDLPQTNHWKYNLKPKMRGKIKADASSADSSPTPKLVDVGDEPTQLKKPHLITKFTKVISKEERLKQLNQMMQSNFSLTPPKVNESTPIVNPAVPERNPSPAKSNLNCSSKSEKSTPKVSGEPKAKKRIPLLVSVPRGQEIPKNYSLPLFLNQNPVAGRSNSGKRSPNSSDITKVADKEEAQVITID